MLKRYHKPKRLPRRRVLPLESLSVFAGASEAEGRSEGTPSLLAEKALSAGRGGFGRGAEGSALAAGRGWRAEVPRRRSKGSGGGGEEGRARRGGSDGEDRRGKERRRRREGEEQSRG
jgi:hypothetical protein